MKFSLDQRVQWFGYRNHLQPTCGCPLWDKKWKQSKTHNVIYHLQSSFHVKRSSSPLYSQQFDHVVCHKNKAFTCRQPQLRTSPLPSIAFTYFSTLLLFIEVKTSSSTIIFLPSHPIRWDDWHKNTFLFWW